MNTIVLEVVVIALLLLLNGLLAMAEISIVSARKSRLQQWADEGHRSAQIALQLTVNPTQFLATVQIGITLVGILAGAFGGATLADEIAGLLERVPLLAPYADSFAIGAVVLVISYFSLVVGELVPKRLGMNNAEAIAMRVARPMQLLSRLSSPIVHLLSVSTDLILRLLGAKPSTEPIITPEELQVLVEQGTESGIFETSEQDMIAGVLRLDERSIGALMIPRTQIVTFDQKDSVEEIRLKVAEHQHSRFPVIQNNLDNVLGIVHAKDLLNQSLAGEPINLPSLLRPPLFVPESMSALRVLELLKRSYSHLALIVDEYGGVQGMITHDDILGEIAGTIPSGGPPLEPQAVRRADGSWLIDGLLYIDDFQDIFDIDSIPEKARRHFHTVGGFIITHLNTIPTVGQSFVWQDLQLEVIDMDGMRVDKVLVSRLPSANADHQSPYNEGK